MGAGQLIVELVAVGTELLLGQIDNSNAAVIGRRLAEHGIDTHFQTVVGDNLERLVAALGIALERSDSVLITGGIGPTRDDLTREAICELAGVGIERDEDHAQWIDARLRAQGRSPTQSVFRMADLPVGATGLRNANGVALGVAMQIAGKWLFAMPGVPAEMIPMLDNEVLPRLREISGGPMALRSRVLHCWGLGESAIAEELDDLFAATNPSVAFLIRDMEVMVRITAKARDDQAAQEMIEPVEREVRARLGAVVFAVDDEKVEDLILQGLSSKGWSVATVENATLGQIGARLAIADRDGAVQGTVVAVAADPSHQPSADVVLEVGPIHEDRNASVVRTTRGVVITVHTPLGDETREFEFGGDDERVRSFAVIAGLHVLRLAVEKQGQR